MDEYIEKPDVQYILHIESDKKVEKRLIDWCLVSVSDLFEDTGLTADVQPVKRGEWEKKTSDFCPNCGARMKEDGDTE